MDALKLLYKSVLGRLEGTIHGFGTPKTDCVVLCLHSTPLAFLPQFKQIVQRLKQHYQIIGPAEFDAFVAGQLKDGPYLLITFDDGIKNNWQAAQWLHSIGVGAYFFVVPDFINSANQRDYYLKHIRPVVDPSFENAPEDFASLQLEDLKTIIQWGHRIGSHTMSHTLNSEMSGSALANEIIASKHWLEQQLRQTINSFCSPNNTSWSINAEAKAMIEGTYDLHFTTFPANQSKMPQPHCIKRRNIEINWSWSRIQFALGQWDLKRWKSAIEQYTKL